LQVAEVTPNPIGLPWLFLQNGTINTLRWLRVIGDSIFAFGAVVLGWFIAGLGIGYSYDRRAEVRQGELELHPVGGD
jgi:nitric oxide reductase subunit B